MYHWDHKFVIGTINEIDTVGRQLLALHANSPGTRMTFQPLQTECYQGC